MPDSCANPLLHQWVKEWLDAAKEQNSKSVFTYKKALESIQACPIVLAHPSQAQELRGVGPKLCDRLTAKLEEHCEQNGLPMPEDPRAKTKKRSGDSQPAEASQSDAAARPAPPAKKARTTKPKKTYVPALRSGAYAIMLALSTLPEHSDSGLTKNQTISIAEVHCNSSFYAPSDPTKTYTAWSSMRTLQDKDLVFVTGGASKRYALTDDGWEVARKMRDVAGLNNDRILNPDQANDDNGGGDNARIAIDVVNETGSTHGQGPTNSQPVRAAGQQTISGFVSRGGQPPSRGPPVEQSEPTLPRIRAAAPSGSIRTGPDVIELASSSPPLSPVDDARLAEPSATAGIPHLLETGDPSLLLTTPSNAVREASPTRRQATINDPNTTVPATCQTIVLPPNSFTIELLLDNREVRSKSDRTYVQDGLLAQGIKPTTRALELGDCTWVARVHDPELLKQLEVHSTNQQTPHSTAPAIDTATEFVLDHLVERKRLDDLIASLKDGRFHEQKFRLRRSGVKHITYLIEEVTLPTEVAQRWHAGVRSALASTLVVDQFAVVRTRRLDDSIRWLARTTKALRNHYSTKSLVVITEKNLDALEEGARTRREADARLAALRERAAETTSCEAAHAGASENTLTEPLRRTEGIFLSYPAFASRAAKQDGLALRDVFLKMLLCTRGVSADKALAAQRQWGTPRALVDAYRNGGGTAAASAPACKEDGLSDQEKKRRAEMLFRATEKLPGRQKIGKAVSTRVAEVWGGLPVTTATV